MYLVLVQIRQEIMEEKVKSMLLVAENKEDQGT